HGRARPVARQARSPVSRLEAGDHRGQSSGTARLQGQNRQPFDDPGRGRTCPTGDGATARLGRAEPGCHPARRSAAAPHRPSAAEQARAEPAASAPPIQSTGSRFPWPVHGHVLASYGVAADGTHNDGINIAASRGTPIKSVESGIVAYVGNELRGYGNLVLIKHTNGWISAYAHCDEVLIRKGDPVYKGQTVAKVGATGGVTEPQLHFELRQGKRPVDPRGFLDPAPSA